MRARDDRVPANWLNAPGKYSKTIRKLPYKPTIMNNWIEHTQNYTIDEQPQKQYTF